MEFQTITGNYDEVEKEYELLKSNGWKAKGKINLFGCLFKLVMTRPHQGKINTPKSAV